MVALAVQLINATITVILLFIFGRVIMDWLIVGGLIPPNNQLRSALVRFTEPILGPIRRYATIGIMDLSPIVAMILLSTIQQALSTAI